VIGDPDALLETPPDDTWGYRHVREHQSTYAGAPNAAAKLAPVPAIDAIRTADASQREVAGL
jgi:hypothetical protein